MILVEVITSDPSNRRSANKIAPKFMSRSPKSNSLFQPRLTPTSFSRTAMARDISPVVFHVRVSRLHRDAARPVQSQPQIAIAPGTPRTPGARRTFNVQLHLHGWILEQQRRWFHQNRLVWRERTHERISRRMQ